MKAIEVNAAFDENGKLGIDNLPVIKNKKARLLILFDEQEQDNDFYYLSQQNLSKGYTQDEPDYDLTLVKEPNPKYERR
ncbi:MAG TPA: hypothetical protein VFW07_10025 [Parafilimonas sp.]|nr:hypothetical protein [Parafilimonas sp.]